MSDSSPPPPPDQPPPGPGPSYDPPPAGPPYEPPPAGPPYQPPPAGPPYQPSYEPPTVAYDGGPAYQPGYPPPAGSYPPPGHPPQPGYPQPPGYPPPPGYSGQYVPGQPVPGPGGPAPKGGGNRAVLFIVLGVVLALLLCTGACVAGLAFIRRTADSVEQAVAEATSAPAPSTPPAPTREPLLPPDLGGSATVVYEVTGDGPASVTYIDESGLPAQANDVDLPWRTELTIPNRALIMLIAIRAGAGDGEIGCRLTVDGREVAETEASGGFATVDCTSFGGN
nr:MmpS family transport accessory protein [Micromonospora sp. DSM 115978]